MSNSGIGVAIVHEVCPICGKPMNESILMKYFCGGIECYCYTKKVLSNE